MLEILEDPRLLRGALLLLDVVVGDVADDTTDEEERVQTDADARGSGAGGGRGSGSVGAGLGVTGLDGG